MVTKKMKGVSPTYLYFNQTFSDFAPRASSALERFLQLYFLIDSPHLLDALGKQLKFQINVRRDFKKILLLGCHHTHFSFSQYTFCDLNVIIVFETD